MKLRLNSKSIIKLKKPTFALLIITNDCNLNCRFCNYPNLTKKTLNIKEIEYIITSLKKIKISRIAIGGGEPFLKFNQLLHTIKFAKMNNFDEVFIVTNGTLIDNEKFKKIAELNVSAIIFSLDGLKVIHNQLRGDKNFNKTVKGIKTALDYRLNTNANYKVVVNTCLNRYNLKEIRPLSEYLYELGVDSYEVQPIVIKNHGFGFTKNLIDYFYKDLWITRENETNLNNSIDLLKKFKKKYPDFINNSSIHLNYIADYFLRPKNLPFTCEVYNYTISVDYNGDIRFCTYSKPVANIFSTLISDILNMRKSVITQIINCSHKCLSFCHGHDMSEGY